MRGGDVEVTSAQRINVDLRVAESSGMADNTCTRLLLLLTLTRAGLAPLKDKRNVLLIIHASFVKRCGFKPETLFLLRPGQARSIYSTIS